MPDINAMREYLRFQETKGTMDTTSIYARIQELLVASGDKVTAYLTTLEDEILVNQSLIVKLEETISELKASLRGVESDISRLKRPKLPPKEPIYDPFQNLLFVPLLSAEGRLDVKGRRKKKLRAYMVDEAIRKVEIGEFDGVSWDFKEYWPDDDQESRINDAVKKRNQVLHDVRRGEEVLRMESLAIYASAFKEWEVEEQQRLESLSVSKKLSRSIHLDLDAYMQRIIFCQSESAALRFQIDGLNAMVEQSTVSHREFVATCAQHSIQRTQILDRVSFLRDRLLHIVEARRKALELPSAALSVIDFTALQDQAESILRSLRYKMVSLYCPMTKLSHPHMDFFL